MINRAVFVGAHPDDVEMNAGGTIKKLVDRGVFVGVVVLSGTEVRRQESRDACKVLGVHELRFLHARDTRISEGESQLIELVNDVLNNWKADTVVTHFHADTHQDHVSTYKIAVAAARQVKNFLMFKPTYPSGRPDIPFHPTTISMLTDEHMQAKSCAINCFASQKTKYGNERWSEAMVAVARGDGWTYGGSHSPAEVFQAGRMFLE